MLLLALVFFQCAAFSSELLLMTVPNSTCDSNLTSCEQQQVCSAIVVTKQSIQNIQ